MERDKQLSKLARLIFEHAEHAGRTATSIDGVDLYRADEPTPIRSVIYHPAIIIVAQGAKHVQVGGDLYRYSPAHYLVLPVTLPVESQVVEAASERPFLSFAIRIDPPALAELVSTARSELPEPALPPRGIAVSEITDELLDASVRLLGCLDSESDTAVLAPQIKREVLYRVLSGPQGGLLRGAGAWDARLNQVSRALNLIHAEYRRPIEVGELAATASMSSSTFYEAFRSVTSLSPLQYIKEIRLNRAREIILWEGSSAKQAADRVGYESASQFSREFRRKFGRSPLAERAWAEDSGELRGVRPD